VQAVKDVRDRGRTCILDIEMEVSFLEMGWLGDGTLSDFAFVSRASSK
jgi:hypothetical protein